MNIMAELIRAYLGILSDKFVSLYMDKYFK